MKYPEIEYNCRSRLTLDREFNVLKAKVVKWYIQMGKCRSFEKVYRLRAKILRATKKADLIKRAIDEQRYTRL